MAPTKPREDGGNEGRKEEEIKMGGRWLPGVGVESLSEKQCL